MAIVYPDPGELWHQLVSLGDPLVFPWKRELIDLPPEGDDGSADGPRPVLYDPGDAAEFFSPDDVLDRCLRSDRLRPDHLVTELTDKRLAARLTRLALAARESMTEQGVPILYAAFGFLRWFERDDSEVAIRSPLLLVPVRLERESVGAAWRLQAEEDDVLFNHTLAQLMGTDFELRLPGEGDVTLDPDDPSSRTAYYAAVQRAVRHHERWEVLDEAALGTFNFQKLAMWEDLGRNQGCIASHDLCRAIAGDHSAAPRPPSDLPDERELDETTRPQETHHILDADSSQHTAIIAATRGANLVLDGPPGTGKSQTIANIIAEFLAAGRTVLFVSEKAAALEVVKRRLDDRGLGDFCLELHSHKASKREAVAELGRCLGLSPQPFRDSADELRQLAETRRQLNEYVRELHACREPLGSSAYEVHGQLARLGWIGSTSRCPVPEVLGRDAAWLRDIAELLGRLPDCRAVIEDLDRHPWRGCRVAVYSLTVRDDVEHHLGRLAATMRRAAEACPLLHGLGFGTSRPTRAYWLAALADAQAVLAGPLVPADWLRADPPRVARAVMELDRVTQAIRQAWGRLPEVSKPAVRGLPPETLDAVTVVLSADRSRLTETPNQTLRERLKLLRQATAVLRQSGESAAQLDRAVRELLAALQVPLKPPEARQLRRLADEALFVARMGSVPRAWWHRARRDELRQIVARAAEEEQAGRAQRAVLVTRLAPVALAGESAPLAREASRYRTFWARLWPRWRSLKGQLAGWYVHGLPETAVLLGDLRELATYHQRADFLRQVKDQYTAELMNGEDGVPDWGATADALRAAERVEQLFKTPAALQAALAPGGTLDRDRLAAAAEELARLEAGFRETWEA
jgi:hypothetical protein